MSLKVTVGIPTKDRYEALSLCLLSIAMQTQKPNEVIIVDDSDNRQDLRNIPNFQYIFELFSQYKIEWQVIYGLKKGQHYSHQHIQRIAKNEWIWRIDDDEVAEPDVLEWLCTIAKKEGVGAVAPLVLMPCPSKLPKDIPLNSITNLHSPNIQWFDWLGTKEVDHLNSSFLYKKGVANYNLDLSPVAHREETLFTYDIKRAGYKLFVIGEARVWHFRQASGGIRSTKDPSMYQWDEKVFQKKLEEYGIQPDKLIVLNCGLGDHWAFKNIFADLKTKYPSLIIATCYPEVFHDCDVKLISIAEAINILGDIEEQSIYRKMIDWQWTSSIIEAFKKLYL